MVCNDIKDYLDKRGIKYTALGDALNVRNSVISAMLSGSRKISVEEYMSICDFLQVSPEKFARTPPTAGN